MFTTGQGTGLRAYTRGKPVPESLRTRRINIERWRTFCICSLGRSLRYVRSKSPLLQADSILLTSSQLLNNVVLFFSCRESSLVSIISTVEAHKLASSSSEHTRQMMIYACADISWGALRPSELLRFPPFSRPAFIIGFTASS